MGSKRKRRPQLPSSTRPRNMRPLPSLSSQSTRATIRNHHNLHKQLSSVLVQGNVVKADELRAQIEEVGGIRRYQQASLQGQSAQRGGDTSKVLVEWMSDFSKIFPTENGSGAKMRLLEVGALQINNACARSGYFDIERIDLHSQHPDIKEQDFMQRQIPEAANLGRDGFDIVSLSLVVNFVGDPGERGDMLRRVNAFLRIPNKELLTKGPALFLVLPAPCVTNSRYLDENRLKDIMKNLGYEMTKRKMSAKLVYYLWTYERTFHDNLKSPKKELRTGRSRNNFAIVLR